MKIRIAILASGLAALALAVGCIYPENGRGPRRERGYERGPGRDRGHERGHERDHDRDRDHQPGLAQ